MQILLTQNFYFMKKLFSFVLLTGMLTLMSFNATENVAEKQLDGQKVQNCWEYANSMAEEAESMGMDYNTSMVIFDAAFDDCSQSNYGMSGGDCIGC